MKKGEVTTLLILSSAILILGSLISIVTRTIEYSAPNEHPPAARDEVVITPFFRLPKYKLEMVPMIPLGEESLSTIKIAVYPLGEAISDTLRNSRTWKNDTSKAIIAALRDHPEAQFVDIGANIGVHSLQAASLGRKVLAVEANPRNCELLSQSLEENGWKDRVTIINHAVDNKRGKDVLIVNPRNIGGSHVSSAQSRFSVRSNMVDINSIFFDDLLAIIKYKTVIVRIDLEGGENEALKSAHKFFKRVNVPVVFMKWTFGDERRSSSLSEELILFFIHRNYRPYDTSKKLLLTSAYGNWPMDIVWMLRRS